MQGEKKQDGLIYDYRGRIPRFVLCVAGGGQYYVKDQYTKLYWMLDYEKPSPEVIKMTVQLLLNKARLPAKILDGELEMPMVEYDYGQTPTGRFSARNPQPNNLPRSGNTMATKKSKLAQGFCVIAPTAGAAFGASRNWFDTEDGAVQHAKNLLTNRREGAKLFVVEVKRVVEIEKPVPPMDVRRPLESDFEDLT